nr:hypothetical protein [uncultured Carboxylicivirga sp.]
MIKLSISVLIIFILIVSCHNRPRKDNTKSVNITISESTETPPINDDNIIPDKLISFIDNKLDSLHIPKEGEYDKEFFTSKSQKKLPYFTSGYFNNDSILDYSLVLIKDSLNHYVFSFHVTDNTFQIYCLDKSSFLSENNSGQYAVFDLDTETEKELEAIDTTYFINNNGIVVSNIYESRTKLFIWNEKADCYNDLVFD